ncbi:helix-turn-helix transcriptional regulator [Arthrobacter sp. GMC3]|uniref:helix-turn-helix domain-containing protein n=1 Tax=Arthrobacter sp. GMC3 TaxID=2058894 RepID=UPI000CE3ED06|nr:helix-turn-helix transcriptional regulator [Arthrobacter sp. GMC3]
MRKEIPAQWLKLMEQQGFGSLRAFAEAAGLTHTVISRMVRGTAVPKDETILAVADTLRVRPSVIYDLVKLSAPSESEPWQPPAEAARLTRSQRDALAQLIRTMVAPGETEVQAEVDHGQRAYGLAANKGASQGRKLHEEAGRRGEESQDFTDDH